MKTPLENLKSLLRPPSANLALGTLRHNPYHLLAAGAHVLDIGAKDREGGYWPGVERFRLISLDLAASPGVDVAADAHRLPFCDASVDAVVCISVLMYTRNPFVVAREICRVLKPGGIVYLNVPWVYRTAPDGDDLYRFSVQGLRALAGDFEEIQAGFNRGPASTTADLLTYFLAGVFSFDNQRWFDIFQACWQWLLFPLKYLDVVIGTHHCARFIYSGTFFLGRKRAEAGLAP